MHLDCANKSDLPHHNLLASFEESENYYNHKTEDHLKTMYPQHKKVR